MIAMHYVQAFSEKESKSKNSILTISNDFVTDVIFSSGSFIY